MSTAEQWNDIPAGPLKHNPWVNESAQFTTQMGDLPSNENGAIEAR
jgi:hypothetical protein